MKQRIDPLIEDRAPWLFRSGLFPRLARRFLNKLLDYDRTVALASEMKRLPAREIMHRMEGLLARNVSCSGLANVPRRGAALVVANHPTGIADGIILYGLLARVRPDLFVFANQDIMRVLPQMEDIIAPVEWRSERRSHAKTRATMLYARKAIEAERLGVIFPSGRLAKRRGLRLHERPWMASAAMLARRFDLPVIPVHISARNSALFYLFDALHPTLRDITLFHETLNKDRQPFRLRIGEPISGGALPDNSEEGIAMLRRATLALAAPENGTVPLLSSPLKTA